MTDKPFNLIPLFGIPLYQAMIEPGITDEEIKFIKNTQYERFAADNGYGSVDKFILEQPELQNLRQKLKASCEHYLHETLDLDDQQTTFEITNSWSVKHLKGDEGGAHTHAGSMFSAVFYVDAENNSGEIVFHKEKTNYNIMTPTVSVPYKNKNFNVFNSEAFAIPPMKNMLVIFPSHLSHSVNPNQNDSERYCIAFNLFAFGEFHKGTRAQLGLKNITR